MRTDARPPGGNGEKFMRCSEQTRCARSGRVLLPSAASAQGGVFAGAREDRRNPRVEMREVCGAQGHAGGVDAPGGEKVQRGARGAHGLAGAVRVPVAGAGTMGRHDNGGARAVRQMRGRWGS